MPFLKNTCSIFFVVLSFSLFAQLDTTQTMTTDQAPVSPTEVTTMTAPSIEPIGLDEKINQAFIPFANAIESLVLY